MMNLNSYYANPFAPSLLGDHHGQTVVNGDAFSSSNTFAAHYNSAVATSNATSNGRGGYDPQRQGAPLHTGGEVKGYRSSPLQMTAPGSDHVRPGTATEVLSPGTGGRHLLQTGNSSNGHLQHDPVPYDGSTLNGRSANGGDGAVGSLGGPHHHQQQQQQQPLPPPPQQQQQQQQRWSQHISSSDSQSPPMPSHPHHHQTHQQGFGPIGAGSGGGVVGGGVAGGPGVNGANGGAAGGGPGGYNHAVHASSVPFYPWMGVVGQSLRIRNILYI